MAQLRPRMATSLFFGTIAIGCTLFVIVAFARVLEVKPSPDSDSQSRRFVADHDTRFSLDVPLTLDRRRIYGTVPRQIYKDALHRMQVKPGANLSVVLHAMHLFGAGYKVVNPTKPVQSDNAIDVILNHEKAFVYFGHQAPLVTTRYGVRCRTLITRDSLRQPEREAHSGQLLAVLGECGISPSTELSTSNGQYAVSDLLNDTISTFTLDEPQLEWLTVGLALYLPPQQSLHNHFGTRFTFDDLVDRLIATPLNAPQLSCQGTHVLYSLSVVLQVDQKCHILSADIRDRLRKFLASHVQHLTETQQPSGRWPDKWFAEQVSTAGTPPSITANNRIGVITAGHHLEWMLLLPDDLAPPDSVYIKASDWLGKELRQATDEMLADAYCPYSHATFSLGYVCATPR